MHLGLVIEVAKREFRLFVRGKRFFVVLLFSLIVSVSVIMMITSLPPELRIVFIPNFATGYLLLVNGAFLPICLMVAIQSSNVFSRECERNMHQILYILPIDTSSLVVGKLIAVWTSITFLVGLPFLAILFVLMVFLGLEVLITAILALFLVLLASAFLIANYSLFVSVLSSKDGTSMALAMLIVIGSIISSDSEYYRFVSPLAMLNYLTNGVSGIGVESITLISFILSWLGGILFCILASRWLLEKRLAYMF